MENWINSLRPDKVNKCALPKSLLDLFNSFVEKEYIPNLILVGRPGCGKTTVALAMLKELNLEYMKINAQTEGNIDTLRSNITRFSNVMSINGKRRYVIVDEADKMTYAMQDGLRAFIEDVSNNCGFIFTCNSLNGIDDAIKSRCTNVTFSFSNDDMSVYRKIYVNIRSILELNNIEFDKNVLSEIIKEFYPDFRHTINYVETQTIKNKSLNKSALVFLTNENFDELISNVKSMDFHHIRKWVGVHSDLSPKYVYRKFYDIMENIVDNPADVLFCIASYQARAALAIDQEINLTSFLVEISQVCRGHWK